MRRQVAEWEVLSLGKQVHLIEALPSRHKFSTDKNQPGSKRTKAPCGNLAYWLRGEKKNNQEINDGNKTTQSEKPTNFHFNLL